MTTLPEEAVKAAIAAHNKYYDDLAIYPSEEPTPEGAFHAALKGALPFLPVQGAVKKLEWDEDGCAKTPFGMYTVAENAEDTWSFTFYDYPYGIPEGEFGTLDEAKAAAQADYEARILSALEPSAPDIGKPITAPSAARELALEEAAQFIESHIYTSSPDGVRLVPSRRAGLDLHHQTIASAIRALSSPDHADAVKVEGDGSRWRIFEAACARGYWGIELEQASNDDEPILYPIKVHRDTLARIVEAHNAGLPSAPASEGAE
ncbi:hypothetical protein [Ochrobactrum sp. CGA5]|uniref:hypothetical protein n=1 Tax=Ochrobactrum sp. CGA5 TaxID=2583453 RepID=UPI00111E1D5E|nr:hypothetical protein [Ochrobactrum sp. CGA5]